jgi:transcriptional regulator with XRE-family HTH domain
MPTVIAFLGYNPFPKPDTLPEQLVWYRKTKGWTQKQFAKALGVDPTTLARWERGERTPTRKYHFLVSSAFVSALLRVTAT